MYTLKLETDMAAFRFRKINEDAWIRWEQETNSFVNILDSKYSARNITASLSKQNGQENSTYYKMTDEL